MINDDFVIIEILGGVADVTYNPRSRAVFMIDWDCLESDACPWCSECTDDLHDLDACPECSFPINPTHPKGLEDWIRTRPDLNLTENHVNLSESGPQ